jgi:ADP-heptose:LPS heptosyltransferase
MAERLLALPGAVSLHPDDTGARDFAETAEIVRGLARVVSVDTAVAHLAAAMGKPTWILLPAVGTDWRWLRDRRDSPWYPSAELFRQQRPGEWEPLLAEIERRLAA